ncbi:hypothetical protein ACFFIS_01960 [Virgibacillus soli]|uniref:Uncharacterized protein n=1 Tax=Paracerasibacillus soli TaxID=480284 RepID=A0ABU5CT25_9BACI|nr:hypothetical protein [Virgibacillus soli]MDY0409536.1 hypothetical protein [Virgibacillus soli]
MTDFLKWCTIFERKLDRQLNDQEIAFIKWLSKEYTKEENQNIS